METKLTLKLDKNVISKAKIYAQKKKISLSKIVELYFKSLTEDNEDDRQKYSPLVHELSGIINLDNSSSLKDDYIDFLNEKYK